MISTLNGWSRRHEGGAGRLGGLLAELEGVVGGDRRAHALLDDREVLGGQRAREQEVVVEAVGDDRTDPELRAGEQVQDGLGQHVRGAVAHRPELVTGRAVVHELVGLTPLGRVEDLVFDFDRFFVDHHVISLESRNPSSIGWTRGLLPRSHRPSAAAEATLRSWSR